MGDNPDCDVWRAVFTLLKPDCDIEDTRYAEKGVLKVRESHAVSVQMHNGAGGTQDTECATRGGLCKKSGAL